MTTTTPHPLRRLPLAITALLATLSLSGCLAAAAVGATGAVVGTAVGVTVGAGKLAVKGTGAAIDAVTPGDDEDDDMKKRKSDED